MARYSEANLPSNTHVDHKFNKHLMLRKNGEAWHSLGDIHRDVLDWECITVYNEDGDYWVGNFVEGLGLINVRFLKADCRELTVEEEKRLQSRQIKITGWI